MYFIHFALTAPYAEIRKMGEKASERSFRPCTSGIHCEYSGIFPCRYLAWRTVHFIFWGLYNGIVIAVSDICAPLFAKMAERLQHKCKKQGHFMYFGLSGRLS